MKVQLEELEKVLDYLGKINKTPLEEITWIKNNEIVRPTQEQLKQWKYTGLNNRDFAIHYLLPENYKPDKITTLYRNSEGW